MPVAVVVLAVLLLVPVAAVALSGLVLVASTARAPGARSRPGAPRAVRPARHA